jgi:hypothetical protein
VQKPDSAAAVLYWQHVHVSNMFQTCFKHAASTVTKFAQDTHHQAGLNAAQTVFALNLALVR